MSQLAWKQIQPLAYRVRHVGCFPDLAGRDDVYADVPRAAKMLSQLSCQWQDIRTQTGQESSLLHQRPVYTGMSRGNPRTYKFPGKVLEYGVIRKYALSFHDVFDYNPPPESGLIRGSIRLRPSEEGNFKNDTPPRGRSETTLRNTSLSYPSPLSIFRFTAINFSIYTLVSIEVALNYAQW